MPKIILNDEDEKQPMSHIKNKRQSAIYNTKPKLILKFWKLCGIYPKWKCNNQFISKVQYTSTTKSETNREGGFKARVESCR